MDLLTRYIVQLDIVTDLIEHGVDPHVLKEEKQLLENIWEELNERSKIIY